MILAKLKTWALALLAVLAAIAGALLYGRRKGRQAAEQAEAVRDAQANAQAAQQVIQAHEVRDEVEAENAKLPKAGPQAVATADPDTAAGRLRDDGWVLPEDRGPH
jgi:type II secretory pathway pseudopilin PulG